MSRYFEQPEILEMAREKSVRGSIVRTALDKAADADDAQYALLCAALRELLERFSVQEKPDQ